MIKHVGLILFAACASAQQAAAPPPPAPHNCPDGGKAVLNGELETTIKTAYGEQKLRGQFSAALRLDEKELEGGRVKLAGLNFFHSDAFQALITGREPQCEKPTGTLGVTILQPKGEAQYLDYNPKDNLLSGEIRATVSISQFSELSHEAKPINDDQFVDTAGVAAHSSLQDLTHADSAEPKTPADFDFPVQTAVITLQVKLSKPLAPSDNRAEIEKLGGEVSAQIVVDPNKIHGIRNWELVTLVPKLELEIIWWPIYEVAKSLCLQPVRVAKFTIVGWLWSLLYSGDGWGFGMPGARKEWKKADVVFEERSWKTVWTASYWTLTESEASALRATVNDDDCIEIFFVDKFSPQDMWGGGATWGGGTAESKVISTDENAAFNIDYTHLAHELSHVMTLKHPGSGFPTASAPHRVDGSSGSLACPSGFKNDNPAVNSQWNKVSVANPLFKFALKPISALPDCQGTPTNNDCGSC